MTDRSGSNRWLLDAAVGVAGIVYLVLALVFQLSSPVFGAAIVIVAGRELMKTHRTGAE